jgi:SAM-dependent methyltransferase
MNRRERREILERFLNPNDAGLEIGPDVRPIFRKSENCNVKYLESRNGDELRKFMLDNGKDASIVEDIDFVLDRDKSLQENVGMEKFDWIVSSHVLEHIPDFVRHLQDVERVLGMNGIYGAIIPDKNFCFDCLKESTSLGDVLESFLLDRKQGSISSQVNEFRYAVRPEGIQIGGWGRDQIGKRLVSKHPNWVNHVNKVLSKSAPYETSWFGHSWQFDPCVFTSIVEDISQLELLETLQLETVIPTYHMDFIAVFKKVKSIDLRAINTLKKDIEEKYEKPSYQV